MTLAIVSATMVSLAISLTEARESGVLKRVRGTPAPPVAVIAGRVGNSVVVSLLMVALMIIIGRVAYGVEIPGETMPGVIASVAVGAAAFSCLGFALTVVIPSQDAAPPITNFAALPLYFLSGVFIPESEIPDAALSIAEFFPIRPLFESLLAGFTPGTEGLGLDAAKLAIVAAWGLAGSDRCPAISLGAAGELRAFLYFLFCELIDSLFFFFLKNSVCFFEVV